MAGTKYESFRKSRIESNAEESSTLWIPPDLPGVELFQARFTTYRFGRHAHEGYVIAAIEEGVESFELKNKRYRAPAGTLVLVEPEMAHTGEAERQSPWSYRALYIDRKWFPAAREPPSLPQPVIFNLSLFDRVRTLHAAISADTELLWVESKLIELLSDLVLGNSVREVPSEELVQHRTEIERVEKHLLEHLADHVRLNDLTAFVGVGEYHLIRVFKRATGFAPYEFLTQARINRARALLREQRPLAFVAQEVGFSDQAHLCRQFKRLVGVTPGVFARASQHRSIKHIG